MTLLGMVPLHLHALACRVAHRWANGQSLVVNCPAGRYRVEQTTNPGGQLRWGIFHIDGSGGLQ